MTPLEKYSVFDIECYPNYFLVQFVNQDGEITWFEYDEDRELDVEGLNEYLSSNIIIGFNSNNYDVPMLALATQKRPPLEQLKEASDAIILNNLKPWHFYRSFKLRDPDWNHIDINEVTPGVMVSLKSYQGRIHAPKMQDLPYNPDLTLNAKQKEEVREYCLNDITSTIRLFNRVRERIELRRAMSYEYKTDLRSKSDAQVAEAVIKAELTRKTGRPVPKPSVKERVFYYKKPDYVTFKTPQFQQVLDQVLNSPFTAKTNGQIEMTEELSKLVISLGSSKYQMGIGGLHSQEKKQAVIANDDFDIYDRDFTSYYPYLILINKWYPENLGPDFLVVYEELVNRRLAAKREGNKPVQESLKITINGTFGKLGSVYSPIYAPDLMIQVTVTGQLTLLMLIEQLEMEGISVVSANTDGIVIKCPKAKRQQMLDIFATFEVSTGYQTEEVQYRAIYSRDVNNYIAITTDGKVKTKGAYSEGGLQKNPENDICKTAVIEYLKDKIPFETTLQGCKDITKFVCVRAVKGGGFYGDQYLGKTVRWYYSTDSKGIIYYRTSGNKVPKTDGCMPIMELPIDFPSNVNYNWYLNECRSLLSDLGVK